MDRQKVITIVANDMLQKMNINQILNAVRGHCIGQAENYYDGLTDDERENLVNQIKEVESRAQAAAQEQQNTELNVEAV